MEALPSLRPSPESSTDQLRRLYRFMASRKFVASRRELVATGFSCSRIDNWVRTGRLIKIVRSVYAYGRDVETQEAVRRAALLAAGAESALIGRSACEAWGLIEPRPGFPALVEVGSPIGQARRLKGCSPALKRTVIKVVRREFQPGDIRMRDGLQLSRAALALIELAASSTDRDVRVAFLEACRLHLFGERDLNYCFNRLTCRRGASKLRPLLAMWVPELGRIRSVLEGWFLLVWRKHGYPMPKVNETVFGHEVDAYWPERGFALELDGDAFHADPVQKRRDREKQEDLEGQGLTVERVTYKRFEANPDRLVHEVATQAGFN